MQKKHIHFLDFPWQLPDGLRMSSSLQNPRPELDAVVCVSCDSRVTVENVIRGTAGRNLIGVFFQTRPKCDLGQT